MKKKSVTSRDVARLAGVSQSAVSRAFAPQGSVSERTRKKVLAAARQLGYRPNTIARSLITRSSRTIAVVIYSLDNPFYSIVLERASKFFQEQGYHLLLFVAPLGKKFDDVVDDIIRSQVEGVLMLAISLTAHQAREIAEVDIPVVIINRTVNYEGISQVSCDNYGGGFWAGSFLALAGRKRIAFLAGLVGSSTNEQRQAGFVDGIRAQGLACHAADVGNYRYADACSATRRLFSAHDVPDAIFAANDLMAVAAMETLRHEFRLRVPEDVAIIGFDDIPMAAWPSHSLTTLQQPVDLMIVKATELLMKQIHETEPVPEHIKLPVTPMMRKSAQSPDRTGR